MTEQIIFKKGNPGFNDLRWLIKAKGDNVTSTLYNVHIDKDYAVAGDKHRMHIVKNMGQFDDMSGEFEVEANNSKMVMLEQVNFRYPNYYSAFPKGPPIYIIEMTNETVDQAFVSVVRAMDETRGLPFWQFSDACSDAMGYRIVIHEENDAIRIIMGDRIALIMPIKMKGGEDD